MKSLDGCSLWPAATCLVSELTRELAQLTGDELRETVVVLPTDRLSRWLYALLSESRPAFVPPRCFVMESFVGELARQLGVEDGGEAPLEGAEQELLLTALLKEGAEAKRYRHLRLGHEHEVAQLFAELDDWELGGDAFPKLAELVSGNVYLSDGGLDTLSERVHELADLHAVFHDRAATVFAAETRSRWSARRYRELTERLESGAELPPGRVYLVGFTSAKGMQRELLRTLVRRPGVRVWLNEPPELESGKSPLALLRTMLDVEGVRRIPATVAPFAAASAAPPTERLVVHRADTVLAEVTHALELAREAVEAGLAPSAIALLVTNDAAYGKPLRALLKGCGFAANVALATPLAATTAGAWLTAVLELLASDESLTRVLALATHPLTLGWWQRETLAGLTGKDREAAEAALGGRLWESELKERLVRELLRSGVERGLEALAGGPKVGHGVGALLRGLKEALGPLAETKGQGPLPLAAWTRQLAELCERFVFEAPEARDAGAASGVKGLAAMAKEQLQGLLRAFGRVGEKLSPPLGRREFLTLVREKLAALEAHGVGDPLRGVQVLSVAEARYVPFELVIVLGCAEGDFPRALPKDHLVDNYLKARIGLPGWQLLEAIEDTTFHLLRSRLPLMVLLYPAARGGEHVVRSRFIEAALAKGEARETRVTRDGELLALLRGALGDGPLPPLDAAERAPRRGGPQGELPERFREGLLETLSASRLEGLVRCPYRFLLESLGIEPAELPREDDARTEGDWLHDVLEAFFTGEVEGRCVAPPLTTDLPWADFPAYALARLGELTTALQPAHAKDSPLELHVRRRSWPAFVQHLLRLYTPETLGLAAAGWREKKLAADGSQTLTLTVLGRGVEIRGAIDAVDRLGPLHVITDYKRSGTPPRGDVKLGLSPQLLVYAQAVATLAKDELPLERAVVGYWSILKGRWIPLLAGSAALEEAKARGLVPPRAGKEPGDTLEGAVARLSELWAWRQDELTAVGASFRPDASACGHCRYTGVCRKDDPELGESVKESLPLGERLGGRGVSP